MKTQAIDSISQSTNELIKVQIIDDVDKVDWNLWFLLIAVLSLIAAVILPFAQRKYEERKSKYGFTFTSKRK